MGFRRFFSLLILAFAFFGVSFSALAQHEENHATVAHEGAEHAGEKKKFNVSEVIFGHIGDSHYWHLFDLNGEPVSLSLPVIIYHPEKGVSTFSASKFHHGHESYNGYMIDPNSKMKEKIISEDGAKIIDFSITKNVLSMLISVVLLLWIMLTVSAKYKRNGSSKAPSGFQNALEIAITFIRDEVAKPNLGHKYMGYMPLLLSVFFFIWINNMLGLLPGGANFTGNISVTACLAIISFLVMVFSGKIGRAHV